MKKPIVLRPLYREGKITVARHKVKGLCLFAGVGLKTGELIVTCPITLIDFKDVKEGTPLDAYPMWWNSKKDCIAFGVINLLNHAEITNVVLRRDRKKRLIRAYAKCNIEAGTELTIHYLCKLWFKLFKIPIVVDLT